MKCEKCKRLVLKENIELVKNVANVVYYSWRCSCGEVNYVEKI